MEFHDGSGIDQTANFVIGSSNNGVKRVRRKLVVE